MLIKKIFIIILFLLLLPTTAGAAEKVEINFFHSQTCPYCQKEGEFLNKLQQEFPEIIINRYDVAEKSTIVKIESFYKEYKIPEENWGLVPATFINGQAYLGFSDQSEAVIRNQINKLLNGEDGNFSTEISAGTFEEQVADQLETLKQRKIKIPFLGEFQVAGFSPLALSSMVGILDGFNACALVALSILLAILISTGNRKRVIIVGGTFILVSGLVYYIFIAAWLNVFLLLGYIRIITYLISLLVIVFGAFLLKDYFNDIICKICDIKNDNQNGLLTRVQRYLFAKANKTISSEMPLILMLLTIAVIAAGINLIELFCSLGFPLAYTKILASHNLPTYQYYLYLLVYIFFYILDDLLIFLLAVFTLRLTKVSDKYLKYVKLISGLVLLILGLIMIFKPELLAF